MTKTGQTFSWSGRDAFIQAIYVCDGHQGLDFNVSAEDITNIFYYNVDYTWDNAPASAVLPADGNLYAPNATVNVDTTFAAGKQIDEGGYTYTFSGWTDYTPEGGSTTQLGGASSFTITADTVVHGAWTKESDSLSSETGTVLIPFVKSWDDEGAESYRPDSISVSLYRYTGSAFDAASAALVETKTVTAADGWSCTFDVTAQPLFDDNGNASKYHIVEGAVTQYEESEHTDPSVTFIPPSAGSTGWNRITPCSELQITSSGTYKSVVVAKKGNVYVIWTADALTENERQVIFKSAKENITGFGQGNYENAVFFSGINGTARGMTVTADTIKFSAPSDWAFFATGLYSKSSTEANGAAITNRFVPPTKSVTVSKSWIDGDSANRPASISVQLLADGAAYGAPVTLTETGNWSYTWTDLPIYADGEEITYTVTESDVQGYTPGYGTDANGGLTITNKLDQVYTSISGTKTWIDPAGTVHPSVTINLLRNGEKIDEVVLPNGTTTYSFESLPLYSEDRDTTYTYTVTESAVDGYTSEQDGTNFTNTIEQEYISVSGTKTWIDPQGTVHPDVTINLLRDGEVIDNVTLQSGTTTYSFTDLDKYDLSDGHIYEYTVEEVAVEGYTSKQEGTDFINTIAQEQIDVTVTKTWADPAGTVHPDITINLLRDGQEIDEVVLQNGTTTHTFEKLDHYDLTDGHEYAYTVTEDSVDGYGTDVDGLTITNTIAQAYTSVSGTKTWIDPQGTEHPSIIINLLRDGEVISEVELQNGETEYAFEELPVYSEDRLTRYTYTVEEEPVEGYISKVEGTDIINTIEQDYVEISGTKTWIDPQGTVHPDVTINLLRDGELIDSTTLKDGETDYSFIRLAKYDLTDGHIYAYSVAEVPVEGYTSEQTNDGFVNTIAQEKIDVTVTKTWADPAGTVHPDITINLLRDGQEIDEVVLKNGTTTHTFADLDRYDLQDGHVYAYTVTEDSVDGYGTDMDGLTITNTIDQAYTSVSGTKTWIDPKGTAHPDIVIDLLRNGEVVDKVTLKDGETTYSFEDLPVYSEDRQTKYTYTVAEEPVVGYTSQVEGTDIINTIEQEKIDISGTKTWIDPQGTEHPTITINLFRDGQKCWSLEMKNGDSRYVFPNLDKYDLADGHAYVYTVEEEAVDGYTSAQNGFDFTNTVAQKALDLTVTKIWKNADGVEHPTITVRLYRDGTEIDKAELKNGVTTFTFKGLDTYDLEDGHAYVYTVGEDKVSGYTSTIDGFTITNTKLNTPVTGDTAVFLPYVALMLLAGGSAVLLIRKKRVEEN